MLSIQILVMLYPTTTPKGTASWDKVSHMVFLLFGANISIQIGTKTHVNVCDTPTSARDNQRTQNVSERGNKTNETALRISDADRTYFGLNIL